MQDYRSVVDYLFQLQRVGIKLGLDNIRTLLDQVGNPQHHWPSMHIAGTNGKGSTAAMVESILLQAGYRVGLYTSPHLVNFTERIRVNQYPIPEEDVIEFVQMIKPTVEQIQPSFFEVTTAMAFWYFQKAGVELAVLETGMGGRLDSTNVVQPLVTAITPVDMDHQNYLGNSLAKIAGEKAGIIKPGVACISNNRNPVVLEVLKQKCEKTGSSFENIFDNSGCSFRKHSLQGSYVDLQYRQWELQDCFISLPGHYQSENALLALAIVHSLREKFPVQETDIYRGLGSVNWRGRLHFVSDSPMMMIDVSHNPAGVQATLEFVGKLFPGEKIRAVTYLQDDKDYRQIAGLLARQSGAVHVVPLPDTRAPLPPETLTRAVSQAGGSVQQMDNFAQMMNFIHYNNEPEVLWLFIGSHHLAGEVYKWMESEGQLSSTMERKQLS